MLVAGFAGRQVRRVGVVKVRRERRVRRRIVIVAVLVPLLGAAQGRRVVVFGQAGRALRRPLRLYPPASTARVSAGSASAARRGRTTIPRPTRTSARCSTTSRTRACASTAPTSWTSTIPRSSRTRSSTCGSPATGRSRPSEAQRLREYLLKGGFVIFDDFEGPEHWDNLVAQMKRALPDHQFMGIDESHPIFHAFYDIRNLNVPHPSMNVTPAYYAMFEQNDPTRRMIALANHNSDIAEYLGVVRGRALQPGQDRRRLPPGRELLPLRADPLSRVGSPPMASTQRPRSCPTASPVPKRAMLYPVDRTIPPTPVQPVGCAANRQIRSDDACLSPGSRQRDRSRTR